MQFTETHGKTCQRTSLDTTTRSPYFSEALNHLFSGPLAHRFVIIVRYSMHIFLTKCFIVSVAARLLSISIRRVLVCNGDILFWVSGALARIVIYLVLFPESFVIVYGRYMMRTKVECVFVHWQKSVQKKIGTIVT